MKYEKLFVLILIKRDTTTYSASLKNDYQLPEAPPPPKLPPPPLNPPLLPPPPPPDLPIIRRISKINQPVFRGNIAPATRRMIKRIIRKKINPPPDSP